MKYNRREEIFHTVVFVALFCVCSVALAFFLLKDDEKSLEITREEARTIVVDQWNSLDSLTKRIVCEIFNNSNLTEEDILYDLTHGKRKDPKIIAEEKVKLFKVECKKGVANEV